MSAAGASAAGAAVAAQIAMAVKASGSIVQVEPEDFLAILVRQSNPLVVHAVARFGRRRHSYLTSYRGLAFFTKSPVPVPLPADAELVVAGKIWVP